MTPELFVVGLAVLLGSVVTWACRVLPGERWQMLASVPVARRADGSWSGVNLTWYGALTATGYLLAVAMGLFLLASVRVGLGPALLLIFTVLAACVPSSRWIAKVVEGKENGFTVGGAAFVGTLLGPWVVLALSRVGAARDLALPAAPALATLALAYAYGEGFGRLACISFGCCYGKPLEQAPPAVRRLFARRHFVFSGETKKIAYASGLGGRAVVPIQAVTSVLYLATALAGTLLYLRSKYVAAYLATAIVTQGWRAYSETLRADYRGGGRLSAYQVMALLGAAYCVATAVLFSGTTGPRAELASGLAALWHPGVVLVLQCLWLGLFLHTGRSTVTGSTVCFHVLHEEV